MAEGFSGKQASEIVGITYRQLDYWARTDLLRPTAVDAQGSGSRRVYTYRDLLELRVIKNMLDAGIRLGSVRDVFTFLRRELDVDIASAHLVVGGGSVVVCNGDELLDAVRNGQGVLNVLPLRSVKDEVDTRILQLERQSTAPNVESPHGITQAV